MYKAALKQELTYVGALVESLRNSFADKYGAGVKDKPFQAFDFTTEFAQIREATEKRARQQLLAPKQKQMRSFEQTSKFKKTLQHNEELQSGKLAERKREEAAEAASGSKG